MANIECYGIAYDKADQGKQLVIRGDIKNNSGRNYHAVAVRIVLFNRNTPLISTVVVVNGLPNGTSRMFEKYVEETDYQQIHNLITRHEIYVESVY